MTNITFDRLLDRLTNIGETTTQQNIANFFSVTQATVSRWKKNNSLPTKYYNILKDQEVKKPNQNATADLIKQIVRLTEENKELKSQLNLPNSPQSKIANAFKEMYTNHHSVCQVSFKFTGMGKLHRRIDWVDGKEECLKYLGYTVKELEDHYWHIGKWYNMNSHPIENLIQKSSINAFRKAGLIIADMFHLIKSNQQSKPFELIQDVVYIHKNGHNVPTQLAGKFSFFPNMKVVIKTTFLTKPNDTEQQIRQIRNFRKILNKHK